VGHFGSYLLDRKDRELVIDIVRAGVQAVSIPIFVKIRLLDSLEETEELVRQLFEAGASLVAIHARFRATFHRNGPGARDGPALLDQVTSLRESFPDRLIVTNGNTITYEDVEMNLKSTKADGLMSAEGILDNPALFLPRLQNESSSVIKIKGPSHIYEPCGSMVVHENKDVQRYSSKIDKIERKLGKVHGSASEDTKKRKELEEKLRKVQSKLSKAINKDGALAHTISVEELAEKAEDKVLLAHEYLNLVQRYPATMRTVIFHIRRMIKAELVQYQLLEDCLRCTSLSELRNVLNKLQGYRKDPSTFLFDVKKANEQKEALAKKKHEEGKRKRYEERMIRKAKREGKEDIEFYLRQGASVPSTETIERLKALSKDEQIALWKELDHSQHCMMYHLPNGCARGRGCAFLHVDPSSFRTFDERDEVAG
jgi:tRNA-dihydrouridine synthase